MISWILTDVSVVPFTTREGSVQGLGLAPERQILLQRHFRLSHNLLPLNSSKKTTWKVFMYFYKIYHWGRFWGDDFSQGTLAGNPSQFVQWIRREPEPEGNFFPISSKYHIAKFHFREEAKQIKTCTNKFPLTTPTWKKNQLKLPWHPKTSSNCKKKGEKTQINMQKNDQCLGFGNESSRRGKAAVI